METRGPHLRAIPVRHAPRNAPCPRRGTPGRRKAVHNRRARTIAYKQVAFLDVAYGEYRARCGCCATFRAAPPGVDPRATYDDKVRRAVLDRILAPPFLAVPELAKAIEALSAEKFAKMIAFLRGPACRRVRTNNHVERVNRELRYEEKARYKRRSRRTTVRFVVLLLDRYWRQEGATRDRWREGHPPAIRDRSPPNTMARGREPCRARS